MTISTVSIILPVYNGAATLAAAIDSILSQTYPDFELVIVDDGSTDDTPAVLAGISDTRLKTIRQPNAGLPAALNRGISLASGTYLARQDHDDLSHPDRLAMQVAYMQAHPDCVLLGARAEIRRDGVVVGRHDHPLSDAALRFDLLFDNPFVHSSVMMRADAVRAEGGYKIDPARREPEDYELWLRLAARGAIANLADTLVIYNEVPGSISRSVSFQQALAQLCAMNITKLLGRPANDRDANDIAALLHRLPGELSTMPRLGAMQAIVGQAASAIRSASITSDDFSLRVADINARVARRYAMYVFNPLRFFRRERNAA
jgi:hypothetical protein